jgi:soluble lytic murein transglycosylase
MRYWLLGLLVFGVGVLANGQAEIRVGAYEPVVADGSLEPAAGPGSLLDARVGQLKAGSAEAGNADAGIADAMAPVGDGPAILTPSQVRATKAALKAARGGQKPSLAGVPESMQGYVQAAYLLSPRHKATATELNRWLENYPALAAAGDIYSLAELRRAKPREVCTTKTIKPKPTQKQKKPKAKKVRQCRTVGEWGPQPPKTAAMLAREARKEAATEAQNERRAGLSSQGRALAAEVWRQRARGDFSGALNTLLQRGASRAMGEAYWQEELVRIADFYHGKREWKQVLRAAAAAAEAQGPQRDEALWLAGYAAYRTGERGAAAGFWEKLVREEPKNGNHYARAAWWAARVLSDLGQQRQANALLQEGARAQPMHFYGQLAAAKLGQEAKLNFAAPGVPSDGMAALLANTGARRGLALAQLGETAWAEAELRAATPSLPPQATMALAGMAVALDLPSTALRAGRDLQDEGQLVAAALYPLPIWKPQGGWDFDKAFILGIMRQESAFQPTIGSRVGAQGLMQIMPATGRYIARLTGRSYKGQTDLHNPSVNIAMAQDYLNYLTNKLGGNLLLVAAAYNGGIGNVQRWIARGVTPDDDPLLWLESIPFDETRDYVEKVMVNYWLYQQRLGAPRKSLFSIAQNSWHYSISGAR